MKLAVIALQNSKLMMLFYIPRLLSSTLQSEGLDGQQDPVIAVITCFKENN